MQEDVYYNKYQYECFKQSLDYFMDRSKKKVVGILGDIYFYTRRECLFRFLQQCFEVFDNLCSIRTGCLEDDTGNTRVPVNFVGEPIS